nr:MAG TPA_asm: hypothetical protein [Bacteriophage sp.]
MQYCKKFLCRTNSLRLFVPHRHIPAVASSHRADPFLISVSPIV